MTDLVEIGELIRSTRKDKKLSQAELGQRAGGVARSTLDLIENGRAPEVGLMLILRVLNALDLDLIPGPYNAGRPTLDQLQREEQEADHAPRMG